MAHDLLIRGGRVIDPAQGLDGPHDIAVSDGRVAAVTAPGAIGDAAQVVDATGRLVVPGLIDLNTHVNWGTLDCLDPDLLAATGGVTTCVDAGTVGALDYRQFATFVVAASRCRVLAFLNASAIGMLWSPEYDDLMMVWPPAETLQFMTRPQDLIPQERAVLRGVTLRVFGPERSQTDPIEAVCRAKDIALLAGVPLMLQFADAPASLRPYLDILTAGDIVSRLYQRDAAPALLKPDGRLQPEVRTARERGILFDVGHGRHWFEWSTARAALGAGLAPDIISSGLDGDCIGEVVCDLPTTMTKFLALGLPLPDIVARVTLNPARALGLDSEIGSLRPGAVADVTLLALEAGRFLLRDSHDQTMVAGERLTAVAAYRAGQPLPAAPAGERGPATWLPR
jgi:dihydroorotase